MQTDWLLKSFVLAQHHPRSSAPPLLGVFVFVLDVSYLFQMFFLFIVCVCICISAASAKESCWQKSTLSRDASSPSGAQVWAHSGLFDYMETLIIDRSSDTSGLVMPAQDIKMEQVNVKCWSGASNAYIECIYKVSAFTNGSSPFSVGAIYINLTAAMLVYFSVNVERKNTATIQYSILQILRLLAEKYKWM